MISSIFPCSFSASSFKDKVEGAKPVNFFLPDFIQIEDPAISVACVADGVGHLLNLGRKVIEIDQEICLPVPG